MPGMKVTSLGFATDLMLRQMEGSSELDQGDYIIVRTPGDPTFYWGNFVLAGGDLADHERWLGVYSHVSSPTPGMWRSGLMA